MIRVNDNYVIEASPLNYVVMRDVHRKTKRRDATGEMVSVDAYSTVGYYSDLAGAIKGVIKDMNARDLGCGDYTLKKAVEIVVENNRKFTELLESALKIKEEI